MNCPAPELLAALYDGLATGDQATRLRDHLAACPRCAQDFKQMDILAGLSLPAALPASLLARLERRQVFRRLRVTDVTARATDRKRDPR